MHGLLLGFGQFLDNEVSDFFEDGAEIETRKRIHNLQNPTDNIQIGEIVTDVVILVEFGKDGIFQTFIHDLNYLLVDPADVNLNTDAVIPLAQVLPLLLLLV